MCSVLVERALRRAGFDRVMHVALPEEDQKHVRGEESGYLVNDEIEALCQTGKRMFHTVQNKKYKQMCRRTVSQDELRSPHRSPL